MAKNKNKGKQKSSSQNSSASVAITDFSKEQIQKMEQFDDEEMPAEAKELASEDLVETNEDDSKVADLKKTGNVDKYIDFLRDKLKRIRAIESKADEIKNKCLKEQSELSDKKKEFEDKCKEEESKLSQLRKDLNNKEKNLTEAQLAIDNGEYTSIIQQLLDSLRKTEEDITGSTRQLVERMGEKHSAYISALSDLNSKQEEIQSQLLEVETAKSELAREQKKVLLAKASYERKLRQEFEDEYEDKLQELEDKNSELLRKNTRLDKEVKDFAEFKRQIENSFESLDVTEMLNEQQRLKEAYKDLENQLENRHSEKDYQEKVDAVEILQQKVKELEEKVSEERLNELRMSLHNADAYIVEINSYKARIDSAEAREKTLLRTIKDLHETINRLKDEEKVKEAAFEQSKRMDNDSELQERTLQTYSSPSSLSVLVSYLQRYMATANPAEPFFYTQKTIRTFLAGLNMSTLTLLQGISGTGKTSLPREIARALVASSEGYTGKDEAGNRNEPYRICPVQSGWRDNMDLIGFYNNFEKKYKETDFFKALYLAAQPKYRNTLFFVILDEMNLSHPEHYFADFLSMMEQSVDDRYVKIQADEELLPKLIKERQMQLPANIRFIGTANHDETTLDFAPKTYDRSNVMIMETNIKDEVLKEIQASKASKDRLSIGYKWLICQFREAEKEYSTQYDKFDKFIKNPKLMKMLQKRGIGIGNRFDRQAKKFICAYLALGDDVKKCLLEAVDHLIASRLLRTLKNRYDLTADNLSKFNEIYCQLFKETFGDDPVEGMKLLNNEIQKKE